MKEEWKNIAGSTWIKVVLAAIIVIPMLYSGIFLGSMWDPYGNADKIPVAVVNEDNKVTYNGSSLHIGEDLVANLKKAKEMDFCFVDAAKASQGLKDGSYYMIITIPENFSSNATTLMDKHPKKNGAQVYNESRYQLYRLENGRDSDCKDTGTDFRYCDKNLCRYIILQRSGVEQRLENSG